MKVVVVSPERIEPRETAVLDGLFAAGLPRYHVRKPGASAAELEAWLDSLPAAWRPQLVLHQHHELVGRLGLGGRHWRDDGTVQHVRSEAGTGRRCITDYSSQGAEPEAAPLRDTTPEESVGRGRRTPPDAHGVFSSRACHDLTGLRAALGRVDAVLFGPVLHSISKRDHGPGAWDRGELRRLLAGRTERERRTAVYALGGVTAANLGEARALGFDGVAVLGSVWQAADPVAAFRELQAAAKTFHS